MKVSPKETMQPRRLVLLVVAAVGLAAITPLRHTVLRGIGQALVVSDGVEPADLLAMDVEGRPAAMLTLSDLYRAQGYGTIGILEPTALPAERELTRRGVVLPDVIVQTLMQLGIPRSAIMRIPAGEGGTTETTTALADWARAHPGKKVLVVVGPSHGRRYRRAIRRAWPEGQPAPAVITTSYGVFHASDWWQSRAPLREALVELQKLALDYIAHPLP